MRKSSGSTPFSGEIFPPRTWYLPRKLPAFSRVKMSTGRSTTQDRGVAARVGADGARVAFRSARRKSSRRGFFAACEQGLRPDGGRLRPRLCARCNARRSAERGPMPGRRPSASIKRGDGFGQRHPAHINPGRLKPCVALPISAVEIFLGLLQRLVDRRERPCPPAIARRPG